MGIEVTVLEDFSFSDKIVLTFPDIPASHCVARQVDGRRGQCGQGHLFWP